MKTPTSPRPHRRPSTAALLAALATVLLLPGARGQGNDTGGPGAIDPGNIATREIVSDTTLIEDSHEIISARYLGTDAVGNYYIATEAVRRDSLSPLFRNAITKYSTEGTLVWRHEGALTSDFKDPAAPADPDYTYTQLSGLSVDAVGNVVVAFNTLTYTRDGRDYNVNPGAFIVGYDPNGRLRWRDLTGTKPGSVPPNAHTQVTSITATDDGGALVLLDNLNYSTPSAYPHRASIVVRLGPDGVERFTDIFGTLADDLVVIPLGLTDDNNGNAFLVTREGRYEDGPPGLGGIGINAIRRIGPNGSVTAQMNATAAESASDGWVDSRADAAGNLYIAANFSGLINGKGAAGQLVLAFNPDLSPRWRALGPQPAQAAEEQPSVEVRTLRLSPGGITVGGTTLSDALLPSSSDRHWEVTRFAYADGAVQWHRLYQAAMPSNTGRDDSLTNLQVDQEDNVYAVGYRSASPRNELVFIKYSAAGDTQFIKPFPAADQLFDPNDQSFQLPVSNHPAFVGPLGGKTLIVLTFDNPAIAPAANTGHPEFFNGETALANGVYFLRFSNKNPFGYYSYLADAHYIYHFDLGYEYVFDANDSRSGVYLYDFKSNGFFYTSPSFPFPYLYDFTLKTVVYYYPDPNDEGRYNTNGTRYFVRLDTGEIFSK